MARVGIIGTGNVGSAITNALVLREVCPDIVLYGRHLDHAEGEAWDIGDAVPMVTETRVEATDCYDDLAGCGVVIVTAGARQKENESRLELLGRNRDIMEEIMSELDRVVPEALVVIVTNPVDVLTRIAITASRRPRHKIFGSGTILDTSRLRYELGQTLGIDRKNVHAHVLGEHGDNEFVLWSGAYVGALPLHEFPLEADQDIETIKETAFQRTRKRAYSIIERKGYTNYGIAVAVAKLVKSILRDEGKILSVSVPACPEFGIGESVVLSLPAIIGQNGIKKRLIPTLDEGESLALRKAAQALESAYSAL